jgi:hypothetical protein
VDLDLRHFIDPQHPVIVKIALAHAALVDADVAIERRSQPKNQAALQLGDHGIRIHDNARIHDRDDALHVHIAVFINLRLRNRGDEASEGSLDRNTPARARRQGTSPSGLFRRKFQRSLETRRLVEQIAAKGHGILV